MKRVSRIVRFSLTPPVEQSGKVWLEDYRTQKPFTEFCAQDVVNVELPEYHESTKVYIHMTAKNYFPESYHIVDKVIGGVEITISPLSSNQP